MATRQEIRDRRRKRRQKQRVTTVLIVAGIALIMVAILMMPAIRSSLTPVGDFVVPEVVPIPLANANTAGDPNAPVVIQEFSDFGCSHCANFALETGKIILGTYVATGKVYVVYNSVGSLLGHPNSISTAEAAYCAGEQNRFWAFHDIIFANQSNLFMNVNQKLDKTFNAYADALGMDLESFESCMKSDKYMAEIQQDYLEAQQAGVNSTPSFLINDVLVVGNQPLSEFQSLIEAELAQAGP